MRTNRPLHPFAEPLAERMREGRISRREYLASMMSLGVTAAGAFAFAGLPSPSRAQSEATEPHHGGTLRISMGIRQIKDPRLFDWPEMANVARQSLEYLVRWERDLTFSPWLLESWETSDDATEVTLNLRQGIEWSNGDLFTAEDVAFNLARWCERDVLENSMAGRMRSLIDPATNRAREGAITILDEHTVRLSTAQPDITLIAGMVDYPAAIVHRSFDPNGDLLSQLNLGTGPFDITRWIPGESARAERREFWWGEQVFGPTYLEAVEWLDHGTDPRTMAAAFRADEIDANNETPAGARATMDRLGLVKTEMTTSSTIVCRFNVRNAPYDDQRVRNAVQLAVDNNVVLALGYDNAGAPAENHHVGEMHPEYFPLPPVAQDVEKAQTLLAEAGQTEHEFELISIDDDWRRETTDAIAAQMRDAGMKVKRTVIPNATFWSNWARYPFSTTNWNPRPLGVQILALAYRSGEAWNETGYADPEFDALLTEALGTVDVEARRQQMARIQEILQSSGIIIQPYWRNLYRHAHPRVKGFEAHQSFEHHLEKVWLAV